MTPEHLQSEAQPTAKALPGFLKQNLDKTFSLNTALNQFHLIHRCGFFDKSSGWNLPMTLAGTLCD